METDHQTESVRSALLATLLRAHPPRSVVECWIDHDPVDQHPIDRGGHDLDRIDLVQIEREQVEREQVEREQIERQQAGRPAVGSDADWWEHLVGPADRPVGPADGAHLPATVVRGRDEDLGALLRSVEGPVDVIWLRGHPTWHSIEAVRPVVVDHVRESGAGLPVVVIDGGPVEGIPAWTPPEGVAAQLRRAETAKQGVQEAAGRLAEDVGLRCLWLPMGPGTVVAVPPRLWQDLGPTAKTFDHLLDALTQAHRRGAAATVAGHQALAAVRADVDPSVRRAEQGLGQMAARYRSGGPSAGAVRLVRRGDGAVFLIEDGCRRVVRSGLVAAALRQLFGAAAPIGDAELEQHQLSAPVEVLSTVDGPACMVVGGQRVTLRGFAPSVVIASEAIAPFAPGAVVDLGRLDQSGGRRLPRLILNRTPTATPASSSSTPPAPAPTPVAAPADGVPALIDRSRRAGAAESLESLRGPRPRPVRADALRVTYFLPQLRIGGGILGVTQLANELRLLGVDARVVALKDKAEVYEWRLLEPPTIFVDEAHLLADMVETDVLVATHWSTAAAVRQLVDEGRARAGVYFLQDYEVWFFAEDDVEGRAAVRHTFDLLPEKIVKSDWLAGLLRADGHATHKIPIGFDLGFFYPRPVPRPDHPVVLAMGRPRTPRRGFTSIVEAFEIVSRARPDTEFVFFGEDLAGRDLPFRTRNEGVVTDQERLARLFSEATVHLDGSDFQAFGRPALEAMACGTASVLTDVGGVGEYARDGDNCLLVPPASPERTAAAILQLIEDAERRDAIVASGFRTVRSFSMRLEARRTLDLFQRLLAQPDQPDQPDPVAVMASPNGSGEL